jgi:hypothetical protein
MYAIKMITLSETAAAKLLLKVSLPFEREAILLWYEHSQEKTQI